MARAAGSCAGFADNGVVATQSLEHRSSSPAAVSQQQAQVELAGFSAQFVVPGRVTIAQDGSTRSFRLGAREIEPQLGVRAAPGLDPKAYLEARFSNDEEAALLPGEVALSRDGLYVGQGRIARQRLATWSRWALASTTV